jgi:hypothetical protein
LKEANLPAKCVVFCYTQSLDHVSGNPVRLEAHCPTNPHERGWIDWVEGKDLMKYTVVGTLIIQEGGYRGLEIRAVDPESFLVAPDGCLIVDGRTEYITSRVSETVDRCFQKVVEGIRG